MTTTPDAPGAPAPEAPQAPPARSRGRGSALDMVRSMAVIVGIVALLVLIVPRPNSVPQPTVDVAAAATGAEQRLGFTPAVPVGLPEGWVPRAANLQDGQDGVPTWHLAYVTPSERFAGIQQAANPTGNWEDRQVTSGHPTGTVQVAGDSWVVRSRTDRGITSWVLRKPGLTTVVTGNASEAELRALAEAVPPPQP